jgi:hypothetical protein
MAGAWKTCGSTGDAAIRVCPSALVVVGLLALAVSVTAPTKVGESSIRAALDGHRWDAPRSQVRDGLAAGGSWIRTCMGLLLSRNLFLVFAGSLFGAGKGRSSSRRLRSGSLSTRREDDPQERGLFLVAPASGGACLRIVRGELAIGRGSRAANLYAVGPFGS